MRSFLFSCCLAFSFLTLFTACIPDSISNTDVALKAIPAEATSVTAIRVPQLMDKADFDNFQKLPIYKELVRKIREENPALAEIAIDPESSGLDLNQNFYAFSELSSENLENVLGALLIPLEDVSAFEAMLTNIKELDIEEKEGYSMVKIDRSTYLLWNESLALLGNSNQYQSDANERLATILNGEGSTIYKNRNLRKSLSKDHDIVTWLSSDALAEYRDAQLMLSGMGFDPDALKGNFVHGYLNFEQGEVQGHSDFLLKKALTKDLDLLFKEEVDTDFSPYFPGENLGMAFSAAFDFKGFNQILSERPQSKGFLNYALKPYGLSVEDMAQALGGDLLLAIYSEEDQKNPEGLFATNIDDKKIFQKFLDFALEYDVLQEKGKNYYAINSSSIGKWSPIYPGKVAFKDRGAYLLIAHNMVFISGNEELLDQIKSGSIRKSDRMPKDFSQEISQHIFTGLVDFGHFKELSKMGEQFPLDQIDVNAGRKSSDFKLKMMDNKNNSLKSLLWLLNEQYEKGDLNFDDKEDNSI